MATDVGFFRCIARILLITWPPPPPPAMEVLKDLPRWHPSLYIGLIELLNITLNAHLAINLQKIPVFDWTDIENTAPCFSLVLSHLTIEQHIQTYSEYSLWWLSFSLSLKGPVLGLYPAITTFCCDQNSDMSGNRSHEVRMWARSNIASGVTA